MDSDIFRKALYWGLGGGSALLTLLWSIYRLWTGRP
jgi:hypothetical protein